MRGRLAPSPTGAQHLGNARTFLLAWLSTRLQNGQLLFRMEDLDSPRVKAWAVDQAHEDLAWLGLDWDFDHHSHDFPHPLIQSHRLPRYHSILETLGLAEQIYPCTCTRKEVEESASAPHEGPRDAAVYQGTCQHRSYRDGLRLLESNQTFAWRFRFLPGNVSWTDQLAGHQSANPSQQLGDFVVGRSYGSPAYQLAVVVDDHDMEITEVLRGDDLLLSTYRQLAIYHALNWNPPRFLHVPLVVGPDGRRLAKRHGDSRLSTFRMAGIHPETIIGFLAWQCGWLPSMLPQSPRDLLNHFQHHPDLWSLALKNLAPLTLDQTNILESLKSLQSSP